MKLMSTTNFSAFLTLKTNNIKYLDEPYTRFKNKREQQETFFIKDPNGNILELKTLKN